MPQFKTGTYVKCNGFFRKILGRVDNVCFLSSNWMNGEFGEKIVELREEQKYQMTISVDEMEACYTEVSALEATGKEEKWKPVEGEKYLFVFDTSVQVHPYEDKYDRLYWHTNRIFPLNQQAQAEERRLELIKPIE